MAAVVAVVLLLLALVAARAGGWLIENSPQRSDLILVLEGEDHYRPQEALSLLRQRYAPQVWIDADVEMRTYLWTEADLAKMYVQSLPSAVATHIRVRGESDLSTKTEAKHVAAELRSAGIHSVILVTSDFATHRALLEFRHEIPDVNFSVAAAFDARRYGLPWWHQREWAKTFVQECAKLAWFEAVDRWR
ncbi:MAG TPA: YdcF family protein [Terriglobales bacterium]|nr:YdcF family protein [Terriglobales bacterium]